MALNRVDEYWMTRALDLARRGLGRVEPNPLVGCVFVRGDRVAAFGWHDRFGGDHAEVAAIKRANAPLTDTTAYVTLEPCHHFGKTPPCTDALIESGVPRVVVGCLDPFRENQGKGVETLRSAGIEVVTGVCEEPCAALNQPFFTLCLRRRPWVIAKWAMSMDGKIATVSGESQWISGETSRQAVHRWRGQVDAIVVGSRTAAIDNPLLTARPPGERTAIRVVIDSLCQLPPESQLVSSVTEGPVLVSCGPQAPVANIERLRAAGVEVVQNSLTDPDARLEWLFEEFGRRNLTNVLVEGGGKLLGALLQQDLIDETRVFVSPMLIGGQTAPTAVAGDGFQSLADSRRLVVDSVRQTGEDVLITSRRSTKWILDRFQSP